MVTFFLLRKRSSCKEEGQASYPFGNGVESAHVVVVARLPLIERGSEAGAVPQVLTRPRGAPWGPMGL